MFSLELIHSLGYLLRQVHQVGNGAETANVDGQKDDAQSYWGRIVLDEGCQKAAKILLISFCFDGRQ